MATMFVPGVASEVLETCEDAELTAVFAIVPEPARAQPLNVAELQEKLTQVILRCSNQIAKTVDDWAISASSQRLGDKSEIMELGKKGGSSSSSATKSPPKASAAGYSKDVKASVCSARPPKSTLRTARTKAIGDSIFSFSPKTKLGKQDTTNKSAEQETAQTSFDKSTSRKKRNMNKANTNVKAIFEEEKNKAGTESGGVGMFKLASHDTGPLSHLKRHEMDENQTFLQAVTRSRTYELVNAILILINAVVIAWESEFMGQRAHSNGFLDDKPTEFFLVMSYMFCSIFTLDLVLRSCAERCTLFISSERFWNIFDVFVVLTMLLEVITFNDDLNAVISKFSMFRIVRLLRIVRVARILKVVRFFRELRVLVFSIIEAIRSLLWSVLLMFLLFVMFGVFLNAGTVDYLDQTGGFNNDANTQLVAYFGTLLQTVTTLFQSISGGVDWGDPYAELQVLSFEFQWCFVAFITFSLFALLNVVTAVFVEGTFERTRKDRDFIMEAELQAKRHIVEQLYSLFEEMDEDGDGGVTLDEFTRYLQDEAILTYFNALGLDIDTAFSLFLLLDTDETGIVDIEEFVVGCVRLKGTSKQLDLAMLKLEAENISYSVQGLRSRISDLQDWMSEELAVLKDNFVGSNAVTASID